MRILSTAFLIATASALCAQAFAQTATNPPQHVPLQKTIGQSKPQVVPSLFVMNSRGASLQGGKLILTGVTPNSIVFADRPVRAAGHELTSRIVERLGQRPDNFAQDPPNATVSAFSKDGVGVKDAVVVLKNPKLEGDRLTFDVDVLEGDLDGADGAASIFIDIHRPSAVHRCRTLVVARRTAYRGAYYAGAAAVGAAAGAQRWCSSRGAVLSAVPPLCGYYPYPPCY